ncbi:kinase-like domain-containing protein [Pilobolus umbonatus]|nr:kinase-like domain-containing protein [Pilobolus umbonatus]
MDRGSYKSSTWPVYHKLGNDINYSQNISNMSNQSGDSYLTSQEESSEAELLDALNSFDNNQDNNMLTTSERRPSEGPGDIILKGRMSSNVEQLQVRDNDFNPASPEWGSHPDAWGCLHNSYCAPIYLTSKKEATDRAGYLVGSDPTCDIIIDHPSIHGRHCVIYYEYYSSSKKENCMRVYLKELSPTKLLVNGKPIESNNTTDMFMHDNDMIYFSGTHERDRTSKRLPVYLVYTHSHSIGFYIAMKPNYKTTSFFDKYDLGTCIGSGNSSKVHMVTVRESVTVKKKVAKIISKLMFGSRRKMLTQFRRETGLSMSLEFHPGISPIKEVYNEQNKYFLLMEYAEQGDLFGYIDGKPLGESNARIVFAQILSASKFLHERNIIHRDIKAENVLVMDKDKMHVKLCDFGLATICRDTSTLLSCCGTPIYAAPEVERCQYVQDNMYGRECDLWSIGVLLYVCLCSLYPFFEDSELSRTQRTRLGLYDTFNPNYQRLSRDAKDLIARLFTVNTDERIYLYDTLKHPWIVAESEFTQKKLKDIHPFYSFPL